jgi:hypothetical protein
LWSPNFWALPKNEELANNDRALAPFFEEVGRIASNWANLEFQIEHTIWQLAEVVHIAGACITSQLSGIGARLRVLTALARLRGCSERTIKGINSFDGAIQPTLLKRNRVVHDWWGVANTGEIAQMRATLLGKKAEFKLNITAVAELQAIVKEISKRSGEFSELRAKIQAEVAAAPNKWQEPLPYINRN